jgi:hypothetical protein
MVYRVKCVCKIQVAAEEGLLPFCCFLNSPVQALHLSLCGVQPTKPLLRGVQQAVPLCEAIEPVRDDGRQALIHRIQQAHWAVSPSV